MSANLRAINPVMKFDPCYLVAYKVETYDGDVKEQYTLATHRRFQRRADAELFTATLPAHRQPIVIEY